MEALGRNGELNSLWDTVEEVARSEGVELFDIDFPGDSSRGGVVRVYITKSAPAVTLAETPATQSEDGEVPVRSGVQFDDCVRVCKRLLDIDEREAFIPDTCTLEVSSPGINRRLRLPQHFAGAVGERVRVKFRNAATNTNQVALGVLRSVSNGLLEIEVEGESKVITCETRDVKEARVDFKF